MRWVRRSDVPDRPLPPVLEYSCHKAATPPSFESDVAGSPWRWSDPFRNIATGEEVEHESRAAFLWDDRYLYAAFDFVDPTRPAIATEPGTHVYIYDTCAEVLLSGPDGGYYEIGVNSIGTRYEIDWQWVEPMVDSGDKEAIDGLFRIPNFLYFAPQGSQRIGRVGNLDFELDGLRLSAHRGDRHGAAGWTAQMALPWESLAPVLGLELPPAAGLELRIQAYRAHHYQASPEEIAELEATYGPGASPSVGWTWSVQGNENVHNLERWARVELSDELA